MIKKIKFDAVMIDTELLLLLKEEFSFLVPAVVPQAACRPLVQRGICLVVLEA